MKEGAPMQSYPKRVQTNLKGIELEKLKDYIQKLEA